MKQIKRFLYSNNLCLKVCELIMIPFFGFNSVVAQHYNLHYQLVKDKENVGELVVSDNTAFGKRSIQTNLMAHIPVILFHINLYDQKSTVFNNHVLQNAVVSRHFLNNQTEKRMTLLHKNKYTDGKKQIESLTKHNEIVFSMTMLYTNEPDGVKSIYSEFHQCYVEVIKTDEHTYSINTPEGQVGYYYYEKGICIRIETITSWATIDTILVKSNIALKENYDFEK